MQTLESSMMYLRLVVCAPQDATECGTEERPGIPTQAGHTSIAMFLVGILVFEVHCAILCRVSKGNPLVSTVYLGLSENHVPSSSVATNTVRLGVLHLRRSGQRKHEREPNMVMPAGTHMMWGGQTDDVAIGIGAIVHVDGKDDVG